VDPCALLTATTFGEIGTVAPDSLDFHTGLPVAAEDGDPPTPAAA
jgi:hypothetical protein